MSDTKHEELDSPTAWERLGVTTIPMCAVKDALDIAWAMSKRVCICLVGETGVGKTPIVKEWADEHDGYAHTLHFGHLNIEQVSMAMFNEDATQFGHVPPDWLVTLNQKAAEGKRAVLFLDEWNRGDKALVNVMFTLPDDRMLNGFMLHENVIIVAAMNPSTGTYMVNECERDHAIRKRLCFMYVVPDFASWLRHAESKNFHSLVREYVRARPTLFYDAAARDAGKAFPCPATWEKASEMLVSAEKLGRGDSGALRSMLAGVLGYTAADGLLEYARDKNTAIGPYDVLENYSKKRKQVLALLNKDGDGRKSVRVDVITTLSNGIAMVLFSQDTDYLSMIQNLGDYLLDLPDELFQTFWSASIRPYTKIKANNTRMVAINKQLRSVPGFEARMSAYMASLDKLNAAANAATAA